MDDQASNRVDWRALWASGDLARFCFISLGILLHATNETMVATIMPADGRATWPASSSSAGRLAIYELGAIVAGAAAGRMVSYVSLRTNMAGAALLYASARWSARTAPDMIWFLAGRLVEGLGGGALVVARLRLGRAAVSRGASGRSFSASCRRSGASPLSAGRCSAR